MRYDSQQKIMPGCILVGTSNRSVHRWVGRVVGLDAEPGTAPVEELQHRLVRQALHGVAHRQAKGVGEGQTRLGIALEGRRVVHVGRGAHRFLRRASRLADEKRERGGQNPKRMKGERRKRIRGKEKGEERRKQNGESTKNKQVLELHQYRNNETSELPTLRDQPLFCERE